ncbi:MAG: hypothetical protein ACRD3A_07940, partial [Terriglobales bacterium]
MRKLWLFTSILLALGIPALAQHEHHAAQASKANQPAISDPESTDWVPPEILVRPLPLRSGIGPVHEAVTTTSKEAQAYYDQGMAYLHSYVWIEAARSFHQALRLDPQMAMAYVGLSRTYSGLTDPQAARAAIQKARENSAHAAEWEKRRIELRAQQLDAIADLDNQEKLAAYRKAIDQALKKRPNEIELLLIRGNAEEALASGRGQFGLATAVPFYDRVLKLQSDNPAAHHYLVHNYEALGNPEEAVKHGEVYARVTPAIAHAQHMYGHDLQKVNRNQEAVRQFQKAEAIEQAYYREEHIDVKYDWHHIHNLDLMSISHAYMGQMKQAEELWRQAFAVPPSASLWEAYQAKWPEFLLERGRAQEALEAAQKLAHGRWPLGRTMGHLLAGRAYLRMNQTEQAQAELAAAEKEAATIEEVSPEPLLPHPRIMPALQMNLLKAELALRAGKPEGEAALKQLLDKAGEGFRQADATAALFLMQLVAEEARAMQKWDLAAHAADAMLKFDANYAGGHYAKAWV